MQYSPVLIRSTADRVQSDLDYCKGLHTDLLQAHEALCLFVRLGHICAKIFT